MGTVLAISAQCAHNIRRASSHRNWPENKEFKHCCNVFPIPRVWQTSEREVPGLGQPAGRARQDMVHWEASNLALAGELAILTTASGPGELEIAKGL